MTSSESKRGADNSLYYGDNLDILRQYIADERVDLIYLDPPRVSRNTGAIDVIQFHWGSLNTKGLLQAHT